MIFSAELSRLVLGHLESEPPVSEAAQAYLRTCPHLAELAAYRRRHPHRRTPLTWRDQSLAQIVEEYAELLEELAEAVEAWQQLPGLGVPPSPEAEARTPRRPADRLKSWVDRIRVAWERRPARRAASPPRTVSEALLASMVGPNTPRPELVLPVRKNVKINQSQTARSRRLNSEKKKSWAALTQTEQEAAAQRIQAELPKRRPRLTPSPRSGEGPISHASTPSPQSMPAIPDLLPPDAPLLDPGPLANTPALPIETPERSRRSAFKRRLPLKKVLASTGPSATPAAAPTEIPPNMEKKVSEWLANESDLIRLAQPIAEIINAPRNTEHGHVETDVLDSLMSILDAFEHETGTTHTVPPPAGSAEPRLHTPPPSLVGSHEPQLEDRPSASDQGLGAVAAQPDAEPGSSRSQLDSVGPTTPISVHGDGAETGPNVLSALPTEKPEPSQPLEAIALTSADPGPPTPVTHVGFPSVKFTSVRVTKDRIHVFDRTSRSIFTTKGGSKVIKGSLSPLAQRLEDRPDGTKTTECEVGSMIKTMDSGLDTVHDSAPELPEPSTTNLPPEPTTPAEIGTSAVPVKEMGHPELAPPSASSPRSLRVPPSTELIVLKTGLKSPAKSPPASPSHANVEEDQAAKNTRLARKRKDPDFSHVIETKRRREQEKKEDKLIVCVPTSKTITRAKARSCLKEALINFRVTAATVLATESCYHDDLNYSGNPEGHSTATLASTLARARLSASEVLFEDDPQPSDEAAGPILYFNAETGEQIHLQDDNITMFEVIEPESDVIMELTPSGEPIITFTSAPKDHDGPSSTVAQETGPEEVCEVVESKCLSDILAMSLSKAFTSPVTQLSPITVLPRTPSPKKRSPVKSPRKSPVRKEHILVAVTPQKPSSSRLTPRKCSLSLTPSRLGSSPMRAMVMGTPAKSTNGSLNSSISIDTPNFKDFNSIQHTPAKGASPGTPYYSPVKPVLSVMKTPPPIQTVTGHQDTPGLQFLIADVERFSSEASASEDSMSPSRFGKRREKVLRSTKERAKRPDARRNIGLDMEDTDSEADTGQIPLRNSRRTPKKPLGQTLSHGILRRKMESLRDGPITSSPKADPACHDVEEHRDAEADDPRMLRLVSVEKPSPFKTPEKGSPRTPQGSPIRLLKPLRQLDFGSPPGPSDTSSPSHVIQTPTKLSGCLSKTKDADTSHIASLKSQPIMVLNSPRKRVAFQADDFLPPIVRTPEKKITPVKMGLEEPSPFKVPTGLPPRSPCRRKLMELSAQSSSSTASSPFKKKPKRAILVPVERSSPWKNQTRSKWETRFDVNNLDNYSQRSQKVLLDQSIISSEASSPNSSSLEEQLPAPDPTCAYNLRRTPKKRELTPELQSPIKSPSCRLSPTTSLRRKRKNLAQSLPPRTSDLDVNMEIVPQLQTPRKSDASKLGDPKFKSSQGDASPSQSDIRSVLGLVPRSVQDCAQVRVDPALLNSESSSTSEVNEDACDEAGYDLVEEMATELCLAILPDRLQEFKLII